MRFRIHRSAVLSSAKKSCLYSFCSDACVFSYQALDTLPRRDETDSAALGKMIEASEFSTVSAVIVKPAITMLASDDASSVQKSSDDTKEPEPEGKIAAGVPTTVLHDRQTSSRDEVWSVIHTLSVPITSGQRVFRNLCLLCVEEADQIQPVRKGAWKKGLCNHSHATNAKMHVMRKHKKHPIANQFKTEVTKRAEGKLKRSKQELESQNKSLQASSTPSQANGSKRKAGIGSYFRPSAMLINNAVAEWLMDDGLPFHMLSPAFKQMLRVASGNMQLEILARDTFNASIDGRFKMFCEAVSQLLAYQHERVHGAKFLTLIHDAWTCNRSTGVIGASVAFIDHTWTFRHIALLATVKNDGHAAEPVSKLIEDRCVEYYNVDIRSMAKWTMSDTTPSARMVASFFEESEQEDCRMHILNLCISYGIGLKENVRTKKGADGSSSTVKEVVTEGGALPEGAAVVRKLRVLNNYFGTPKRIDHLKKIQQAHGLPCVLPLVDVDVRVASTCRLMRRSIVNYTAFKMYFIDQRKCNAFTAISETEWAFVSEMEAATQHLAQLALAEVQSQSLLASYMLVFRTTAEAYLKSRMFRCLKLEPPDQDDDVETDGRDDKLLENFTAAGQTCVSRCLAQVRNRFPTLSVNEAVALLLDPRTKDCADAIIDGMGTPTALRDKLLQQGTELIVAEQIRLQQQQAGPMTTVDSESPGSSPPAKSYREVAQSSSALLFGAPVPTKTKRGFQESHLKDEATAVFRRWMAHQEDWVSVALAQGATEDRATLAKSMCFRRGGAVCWNVVELFRLDILRWFREVGEPQFPTIAMIARIQLGKVSSSAFQERVFSTGGVVMSPTRTQTDNDRAEKQLLLCKNKSEIQV